MPDSTPDALMLERARQHRSQARSLALVLDQVRRERERQDALWGEQNHPDATWPRITLPSAHGARHLCNRKAAAGNVSWLDILAEEVAEVVEAADNNTDDLRAELVQVAAVAVCWVEAIDRRRTDEAKAP